MVSKVVSRILNRSIDCSLSSYVDEWELLDGTPHFYFAENEEIIEKQDINKTDSLLYYSEENGNNQDIKENQDIDKTDSFSFSNYFGEDCKNLDNDENLENDKTDSFSFSKEKQKESFSIRDMHDFEYFEKEKKFLGTITHVDRRKRTFETLLICTDDNVRREAEFSIEEVLPKFKPLIEVGRKIIYIYGKQYRNGTVTNVTNLYFRNESNWTDREINNNKRKALELYNLLKGKLSEI